MPIDVDVDQRLDALAKATVAVSLRSGTDGVTIRAVAQELGGSTTLVTNYLPSRSALLANAVAHVLRDWNTQFAEASADVEPQNLLRAAARWASTNSDGDVPLRQLIIELVARPALDEAMEPIRADARAEREELVNAARDAGATQPDIAADAVFLLLRGFYLASLEDPEIWTSARVDQVLSHVIDALVEN